MKNKKGLITFALLGLVVGSAAYYLLATDDGKKRLSKTNCKIKDLTKSLKDLSKKESKIASKITKNVKSDLGELADKVKSSGKEALNIASETAKKEINKAKNE